VAVQGRARRGARSPKEWSEQPIAKDRRKRGLRSRVRWRLIAEDVRFEVFTAVTMKNVVFWDVTSCGCCKNRRFIGT
jgi:hypothetical protein